jgi:hypothetical protein
VKKLPKLLKKDKIREKRKMLLKSAQNGTASQGQKGLLCKTLSPSKSPLCRPNKKFVDSRKN